MRRRRYVMFVAGCVGTVLVSTWSYFYPYWNSIEAAVTHELAAHDIRVSRAPVLVEESSSVYERMVFGILRKPQLRIYQNVDAPAVEFENLAVPLERIGHAIVGLRCPNIVVGDDDVIGISEMVQLRDLYCNFSGLSDSGATRLSSLRYLRRLQIHAPNVSDDGMAWLSTCEAMIDINLSHTSVGDQTVAVICTHGRVESVRLSGTGVTDAAIDLLGATPSLQYLDISHTRVSDLSADYWKGMTALQDVDVSFTRVGDEVADALSRLPMIESVRITGSHITIRGGDILKQSGIEVECGQ